MYDGGTGIARRGSWAWARLRSVAGIPLSQVAGAFGELTGHGVPTQADWQRLSGHWQSGLDAGITALEKLRGSLGGYGTVANIAAASEPNHTTGLNHAWKMVRLPSEPDMATLIAEK